MGLINQSGLFSGAGLVDQAGLYNQAGLYVPGSFSILDLQPAAAYSLRSFDAAADPNVVNVRRSSDGATSDFTASEVSDGTLTDWVNTDYNRYTSDFSSGVDSWTPNGVTVSNPSDPVDPTNNVLQLTAATTGSLRALQNSVLTVGQSYEITAQVYIPSSNSEVNGVLFLDGYDVEGIFGDGEALPTDQWVTVTGSGVSEESRPRIQLDGTDDDLNEVLSSNAIGDIVYVKNVQITQTTADGHVTTWYDQSDNGNDSTQTTASAQPKIVDAGTLVTDSSNNPAIIGDGVDDTLFHPTLTDDLDSSDFLVTAAYEDDLAMGIIGALPRLYLTSSSMSYNTLGTIGYPSQTGRNVISFQVAGSTQEVFGNGASLGTASEAQVDLGENMFNVLQGGSSFSDGPLMEVVVFGDNQSASRTGIENNINDHFDIYS
jgi:hypothetical protein